jgi:hypothetical protein
MGCRQTAVGTHRGFLYREKTTIAGGAFIRIDVPHPNEVGKFRASQYSGPSAVYAVTPTTEEVACVVGRRAPEPVSRWELPALPGPALDDADTEDAYEVNNDSP